jgi:hypothetical protein
VGFNYLNIQNKFEKVIVDVDTYYVLLTFFYKKRNKPCCCERGKVFIVVLLTGRVADIDAVIVVAAHARQERVEL